MPKGIAFGGPASKNVKRIFGRENQNYEGPRAASTTGASAAPKPTVSTVTDFECVSVGPENLHKLLSEGFEGFIQTAEDSTQQVGALVRETSQQKPPQKRENTAHYRPQETTGKTISEGNPNTDDPEFLAEVQREEQRIIDDANSKKLIYRDPYPGVDGGEEIRIPCGRCGGSGTRQEYKHVEGGVCFQCEGEGFFFTTASEARVKEQRRVDRVNKKLDSIIRNAHDTAVGNVATNREHANRKCTALREAIRLEEKYPEGTKIKGQTVTVVGANSEQRRSYGWPGKMETVYKIRLKNTEGDMFVWSSTGKQAEMIAQHHKTQGDAIYTMNATAKNAQESTRGSYMRLSRATLKQQS